ncbi:biotin transport system permease protein [Rhizobium sp. RU20A]|uniref:energy-coupling factor transporter transmembrane component T family protein n=1 Tax=Rhizobium sp. RU20A TaxID=1907412 RepID=UPI0009555FDE|nr:energy-coupling factor transporter transmembrane protein EcfT [Rhizobium sp. RU20A]SIR09502.1 biotin transport system permease protein [Rhizobium sp. RU20A]
MLTSLHVEGDSLFHRLTTRVKLAILLIASILAFLTQSPVLLGLGLLVAGAFYFTLGLTVREGLRRLRPVLVTIALLAAVNLIVQPPLDVLVAVLRILALVLLAATVTATTTISAFMEEITRLLLPVERLGLVRAADVALALGLVLRFVPDIFNRYSEIREAHLARGLKPKWKTLVGPLIILTLKDADAIATAIDARGLRRGKRG